MRKDNQCSDQYQESVIPIVDHDSCNKTYQAIHVITERMVCAGNDTDIKKTCRDDFGSPLTCIDQSTGVLKLTGIVSWANGCGSPGYPGVYADVVGVRSWISSETGI